MFQLNSSLFISILPFQFQHFQLTLATQQFDLDRFVYHGLLFYFKHFFVGMSAAFIEVCEFILDCLTIFSIRCFEASQNWLRYVTFAVSKHFTGESKQQLSSYWLSYHFLILQKLSLVFQYFCCAIWKFLNLP